MKTELVSGLEFPEDVAALFQEYTDSLLQKNPVFSSYLARQNYEEELKHLAEKYGPPLGKLYLLRCDGEPAGTIALRPLDDARCEMKRLYVRPPYRGNGFARMLTERIVQDAAELGFHQMLFDTFPFLVGAIRLYRNLGFYEIPSYNGTPMPELLYFCRDL